MVVLLFTSFLVATLIRDGRYGNETSEIFLSNIYCRRVHQSIGSCNFYQSNQCNSYGCSYNKLGLKCYGKYSFCKK